jgi:hypothetical protein
MRFDGSTWNYLGRLTIGGMYRAVCVAAYADNDAFVWGYVPGAANEGGALYRVTNGVQTLIANGYSLGFSNRSACGIHAFSPTNIVATANREVFKFDAVAKTTATLGTALISTSGALWTDDPNDIFVTSTNNALRWTGGPTWTALTTGLSGQLGGISGTSSNRVFAAGWAAAGSMQVGTVLFWDGLGWTVQTMPAGTKTLQAVWASALPEGRVFAVGINGTIVTGP